LLGAGARRREGEAKKERRKNERNKERKKESEEEVDWFKWNSWGPGSE